MNSKMMASFTTSVDTTWVTVGDNRDYPIVVGSDILKSIPDVIRSFSKGDKVVIITNSNLKHLFANSLLDTLKDARFNASMIDIPAGESFKTLDTVSAILDNLLGLKLERQDTIIALGGGVIGDMAGFAASIYMRGINLIQVPSTLLAQVDSAIGGKTGVNHAKGKNLIGAFYQPKIVVSDITILATLAKREVLCGLAEIVKYGIIRNPDLFQLLEEKASTIATLNIKEDTALWQQLITLSSIDKATVVSQDEHEKGFRETLNLGHTIGHGIEAATGYTKYLHGEAVAIGIELEAELSVRMGVMSENDKKRIVTLFKSLGFQNQLTHCGVRDIMEAMSRDKKVKNGRVRFIVPTKIGDTTTIEDADLNLIEAIIDEHIQKKEN